jgi:hypothetical protein
MAEGTQYPSLCGGSMGQWAAVAKQGGWKMVPHAGGIEAFLGHAGVSGNWAAGYLVVDWARRPLKEETYGLQDAIRVVEAEGAQLAAKRDKAEREAQKTRAGISGQGE